MRNLSTIDDIKKNWNMIFNISLNMLHNRSDAEDATQEIFIKVLNNYKEFRHDSRMETWIYKIACNYLIDCKNKMANNISFEIFENDVNTFQEYNNEFNLNREEEKIYAEQVKIGCTRAMLQCLEPENRLVLILGEIFNFKSSMASEICGLKEDVYRQRLSRTRKKIRHFMNKNCGLVNKDATCKCSKRLKVAHDHGRINFDKSLFQTDDKKIKDYVKEMNEIDRVSQIFRDNPFIDSKELFKSKIGRHYNIIFDS